MSNLNNLLTEYAKVYSQIQIAKGNRIYEDPFAGACAAKDLVNLLGNQSEYLEKLIKEEIEDLQKLLKNI